ncbi:MAG: MerR family transcriptional regulator [Christensenellaceae bacterium]|nr:MerR family transcriptional regulator [Christensenellaceae bacterium]
MNIGELSRISGVSVRTLRHYDAIGLLKPDGTTDAGYRQYDESSLQRLFLILLFRELRFPLKDIRDMLNQPDFDPVAALEEQIALLEEKRRHIDNLILLARGTKMKGLNHLHFSAFDAQALDETAARVADTWQDTPAMQEFRQRDAQRTDEARQDDEQAFDELIASFGKHPDDPASPGAQAMAQQLRDFITAHFYDCTLTIFRGLADLYDGGGEFTQNIDKLAGKGTASWLAQAVRTYCDSHE